MKILYITTIGSTMGFFKSLIKKLIDDGNTVDIATNETDKPVSNCYRDWGCNIYPISTSRSPFSIGNLKAIKQIKKIVKENQYEIVHCHTPLGAVATRFACKGLRKKGVKVIYTAHGFHFYKGAPKKNWIIYYPIEKLCARWTDVLITINNEDYEFAKKKLHAKRVEYVPGVGIDVDKFANTIVDKAAKRREIGVPEDAFLLLSVGELNENKNHQIVIKALAEVNGSKIHYAIAGMGDEKDELEKLAKDLNVNLHLLGYRSDVAELYKTADTYILPSLREGLNVSIMEAMASGLPVICGRIRGNVDLVDNCGGWTFRPSDKNELVSCLSVVSKAEAKTMGENNQSKIRVFDVLEVNKRMLELYGGTNV